ncbi:MAG TPA: type II toxin-antitoxin system PemK/MazF family toxin [Terriglobia bacterium]|nr:type II toxin-antitoxin system PemK/MazF family toxin [Terriglobia bacterium]
MKREWAPDAGDLVWLTFDPQAGREQAGREQAGRRPALVLSREPYNRKSGLALVCPITSHVKGYPFEVKLPPGLAVSGVILADHLKSADWRGRRAERAGHVAVLVLQEVLDRLAPLLGY